MDADSINIISLAYLGDAVYELYVREHLLRQGISKVIDLQKEAVKYVSAKNQSDIINYLINDSYLNDDEIDIVKRGRNYKRDSHPKNTNILTYKMSTGFEALIGYLYIIGNNNRIHEIMDLVFRRYNEKNN